MKNIKIKIETVAVKAAWISGLIKFQDLNPFTQDIEKFNGGTLKCKKDR